MNLTGIHIDKLPDLESPLLVAGFGGWGNALDVAKGTVGYLVRKLGGTAFARLDPDLYFRYDEQRPVVNVAGGELKSLSAPEGRFFYVKRNTGRHLVLFKAEEPGLRWSQFASEFFEVARRLGVRRIVTLGSMFDKVLHTERTLSALASGVDLLRELRGLDIRPIDYQGPTAIHAVLQMEAQRREIPAMSVWAHCPYYLEGTPHFALLSRLGTALAAMGGFRLDVDELEISWRALRKHIDAELRNNPKLQAMVADIHKSRGWTPQEQPRPRSRTSDGENGNVIDLRDFLDTD